MSDAYVLHVPGKPVPWSKGAPPGRGPQVPERQGEHASLIRQMWREQHGDDALRLAAGHPVRITGEFRLTRPQKFYGTGRNERLLKADIAPMYPTGKPDLSNLLKMVEDALTHVIWEDDDQVVDISGSKRLIHPWQKPCSIITITPIDWATVAQFRLISPLAEGSG